MFVDKAFKPKLYSVKGKMEDHDNNWVSRVEYERVKRNCEQWYKMWLHERQLRK